MSAVAVLDCTSAVTPMPESAAVKRLPRLRASHERRLAPNTRNTPVRTRCMPQISRAIAASKFSRCFMSSRSWRFNPMTQMGQRKAYPGR